MKVDKGEVVQVKTFVTATLSALEYDINEFLNTENNGVDELEDIKFFHDSFGYHAMVIFKYIS